MSRKGKPFDYLTLGCRIVYGVEPFQGEKVGKNWPEALHLTDYVYLFEAKLKGKKNEAASRGNAEHRHQPFIVASKDYCYFPDVFRSLFHA